MTNGSDRLFPVRARARVRGFSLIEVLIAVLVLGLGLLGLGAIFPVVIAQQRDAFNASQGADAADAAFDMLADDTGVLRISGLWERDDNGNWNLGVPGPGGNQDQQGGNPLPLNSSWIIPDITDAAVGRNPRFGSPVPGFNVSNLSDIKEGKWSIDVGDGSPAVDQQLIVTARLFPAPDSGADPRFVWDPVIRRTAQDTVQVAIFVRRIDERIRVPRNYTLSDMLTNDNNPGIDRPVLPLALDLDKGRQVTDDGQNQPSRPDVGYPIPVSIEIAVYEDHLDWAVVDSSVAGSDDFDTTLSAFRRVGQKFVDNTGVVRTVIGLPEVEQGGDVGLAGRSVVVDPPFVQANASEGENVNVRRGTSAQRTTWIQQAVFTPQVPAAVRVYTLRKPRDG